MRWAVLTFTSRSKLGYPALGGKSPVFIDAENTDIELAAKRALWGRQVNAGQLCVSPDYILVPKAHQDAFVAAVKKAYAQFYPEGALHSSATLTGVHPTARDRLKGLLASAQGELGVGGREGGRMGGLSLVGLGR